MEQKIEKYTYTRSLCMLLYRAVVTEAPGKVLRIEHSISRGQYCRLLEPDGTVIRMERGLVERIRTTMRRLVELDLPIERGVCGRADAIEMFGRQGLHDKVELLRTVPGEEERYYTLDGIHDSYIGDLVDRTGQLKVFDLRLYKEGMLLLGPDPKNPAVPVLPIRQAKMYRAFQQSLEFNQVIRISDAAEMNRVVQKGDAEMMINVAETMHTKLLGRISDDIMRRRRKQGTSVILLAGPSSSGKTTTCKRLACLLYTSDAADEL